MVEDPMGIKDDKFNEEYPYIETAEELYAFYTSKSIDFGTHDSIIKDLKRTDPGNEDWKVEQKTGSNHLYNVLRAYVNYDPEIGYAQGMGIVVSWLLRHTRSYTSSDKP